MLSSVKVPKRKLGDGVEPQKIKKDHDLVTWGEGITQVFQPLRKVEQHFCNPKDYARKVDGDVWGSGTSRRTETRWKPTQQTVGPEKREH